MANYFAGAAYQGYSGAAFAPTASFTSGYPVANSFAGYNSYPAVSNFSGVLPTDYSRGYSAAAGLPFSSYSGAGFATTSSYGLPSGLYSSAYNAAPSVYPELASYSAVAPYTAYGSTQYLPQQSVYGGLTATLPYGATSTYAPSSFALAPFTGFTGFSGLSGFSGFPSFAGLPAAFPGAPIAVPMEPATLAGEIPPLSSETVAKAEVAPEVAEETVVVAEETQPAVEAGASAAF